MFFKQVWRNALKNRKGNGLFLGSLVIAIVAFYTLLSLEEQDVMQFLSTIESDAVGKLLLLLPIVYVVSLFFLFFLVYFACKYQTGSRRREFGMYLMLGMRRGRLFAMLFCETLLGGLFSLLIGIPIALFLTEGISLATAKIVGLGMIGHHVSFSLSAVLWTVCGFVVIQILSMFLICIQLGRKEPAEFLRSDAAKKQTALSGTKSRLFFVVGVALLLFAYYLGIFCLRNLEPMVVISLFASGTLGTFLFYLGFGGILGRQIRKKTPKAVGLDIFTARQVQEQVLSEHKSLAVCSLLLLLALSCISYGISIGIGRSTEKRSVDFSLFGTEKEVREFLEKEDVRNLIKESYPVYLSRTDTEIDSTDLLNHIGAIEDSENIVQYWHCEYVIAASAYDRLLHAMGKEELHLEGNQAALFSSAGREGDFLTILDRAVREGSLVKINGETYELLPALCYDNIVADRAITLYAALIVPDALFQEMAKETDVYCWNIHLTDEITEELGLMQAIQLLDGSLGLTGIRYDSFLKGIGRNLFYTVAASYLTIYLGILFLLIANTVIGLKYLIQQRQTKQRYLTLLMLGAGTEEMCRSVKSQIQAFFLLVLAVAGVSSVAAVASMFLGLTKLPIGTSPWVIITLAASVFAAFLLTEVIYIGIVKRTADSEVRSWVL